MNITDAVREKIKRIRDGSGMRPRDVLQYGDMEVEVRDTGGALLFTAILRVSDNGAVAFVQLPGASPHPDMDYIPAQIRGYNQPKKKTVYMRGTMARLDDGLWHSPDLTVTRLVSDRAFYRVRLNLEGGVRNVYVDEYSPCRVRDISVGGVRITSWTKYAPGDNLVLAVEITDDNKKSKMKCRVVRVTGEGPYSYNCAFISMDDDIKRKLTRDIFNAQIAEKQ